MSAYALRGSGTATTRSPGPPSERRRRARPERWRAVDARAAVGVVLWRQSARRALALRLPGAPARRARAPRRRGRARARRGPRRDAGRRRRRADGRREAPPSPPRNRRGRSGGTRPPDSRRVREDGSDRFPPRRTRPGHWARPSGAPGERISRARGRGEPGRSPRTPPIPRLGPDQPRGRARRHLRDCRGPTRGPRRLGALGHDHDGAAGRGASRRRRPARPRRAHRGGPGPRGFDRRVARLRRTTAGRGLGGARPQRRAVRRLRAGGDDTPASGVHARQAARAVGPERLRRRRRGRRRRAVHRPSGARARAGDRARSHPGATGPAGARQTR